MRKKFAALICNTILVMAISLTGCAKLDTIQITGNGGNNVTSEDEETVTVDMPEVDKLFVENRTGNIKINKTGGDKINVRAVKKVQGSSKDDTDRVLKNIAVSSEVSLGKLQISVVTKEGKKDFWEWKNREYRYGNVSVELNIDIPENFKNYEIKNTTGQVELSNLEGNVKIKNTTGNISLMNVLLDGNNSIELTTGNINIDGSLAKAKELDIENTTGNIKISVPSDSAFTFDARVTTGNIGVDFGGKVTRNDSSNKKVIREFNDGGRRVTAKVTTGNINLNNK